MADKSDLIVPHREIDLKVDSEEEDLEEDSEDKLEEEELPEAHPSISLKTIRTLRKDQLLNSKEK